MPAQYDTVYATTASANINAVKTQVGQALPSVRVTTAQDLLKRRENARVAMELDVQHRGFNLMVQEPAEMPVAASGLRLMHLSLIGIILALAVPLGILFLIVQLDRRVRSPLQVERMARVPLLGTISDSRTRREKNRVRMRSVLAASMVIGVFVVYAAAFLIKLKTSS